MNNQQMYCFELTSEQLNNKEAMDSFSQMMGEIADSQIDYETDLAKELGVSVHCACDIFYLRSRSRWTQELEDKLIKLHAENNPPNIFEFGH